jgi:hypothetical protein
VSRASQARRDARRATSPVVAIRATRHGVVRPTGDVGIVPPTAPSTEPPVVRRLDDEGRAYSTGGTPGWHRDLSADPAAHDLALASYQERQPGGTGSAPRVPDGGPSRAPVGRTDPTLQAVYAARVGRMVEQTRAARTARTAP